MEPRVRGRHMKSLLAAIDRLPAHDREAVDTRIARTTRQAVGDATGVDWLPVALNVEVTHALYAGLGPDGAGRFFREAMGLAFTGPLLRVIVEAALRVFRLDAASFASWVGTGWSLVFRECGRWSVVRAGAGEAELRIEGLPRELAADRTWLGSNARSLEAFFDVARAKGSVSLEHAEPELGLARYVIRWT